MKAKSLIIVLSVLMLTLILDRAVSTMLDFLYEKNRFGQSGGTINYFITEAEKNKFDYVIIGNSRAHHNLNPDSLGSNGFNLSHNGMNLSFQVALIHVLATKGVLPKKKIILHVEPEDFKYWEDSSKLFLDAQHLKHYYHKDSLVRKYINNIYHTENFKYYFHSYRFNGQIPSLLKNVLLSLNQQPRGNGFVGKEHQDYLVKIIETQAHKYRSNDKDIQLPVVSVVQAENLLTLAKSICDKEQIELELFTSPFYYTPVLFKHYSKRIDEWSKANKITYQNFAIQRSAKLDSVAYWLDNDHLSAKGAAIFSGLYNQKQLVTEQ